MEDMALRYYKPSGSVPMAGTLLMQLFGAIAAAVLGVIYAAINVYNPFIYLTFFAVLIFGAGVGFAVQQGAKLGKVRNTGFITLIGAATGLLAVYLAWVFYFALQAHRANFGFALIFNPATLWEIISELAETGAWSFKSWTPTGWVLYAFWAVEAGIIFFISLAIAGSDDTPFCDECNRWTETTDDVASFGLTDPLKLKTDLEEERYEALDDISALPVHQANRLKAVVHSCPHCEDTRYLTISHCQLTVDGDGNESTEENEFIKHLAIPVDLVDHLQELEANRIAAGPVEDPAGENADAGDKDAEEDEFL